ncbi:amino acid permease-domain-containing protein [Suillus paluster]|uniref:amino acid permease-domain-containing protein n=1 Tax=Suillus paluster TaxID=48578 RepID=UPI001B86475E|nr:amino acid permease-domain-containing protein [Suillus paluster]KAG1738394.1 amino acid permease-domain-containing protein [Suillus paluster]
MPAANVENALDSDSVISLDTQSDSEDVQDDSGNIVLVGAPIEQSNPLGHEVTLLSSVTLNLGRMLGAGIYSVPGVTLNSVGSIGLLFVFWLLAPLFALGGLMVYSEYASMFPKRSGAEVVYLEQAYPRPQFLVPVAFAVNAVLLDSSATSSIVFAQYVLVIFDVPITPARQTAIAIAVCTVGMAFVGLSTKWSLRAVNFLSVLKVLSIAFLVFTGALVLGGFTRIRDPYANFRSPFSGSTTNPNSLATALVKTSFAFSGWHNAFNVLGEVRTRDPVRTVRKAGLLSLLSVTCLFFFANVAYVAAVPKDEMSSSGQLIAALFFQRVFGQGFAAKTLPIMVALSCFGSILAVTIGQARILREVARQGLLPYPRFFASTKPFGTPLAPVCLRYFLTVFVMVALPAQDAFNFLVDLVSYPGQVFTAATAVGVWLLRRRRSLAGLAPSKYRARNIYVSLYLLGAVFILIMAWVPPEPGHGDVSFWYATYCVVGLGVLALCGVYYWLWIVFLPWLGGYTIVEEVERLDDGALVARLTRKYHPSVAETDNREQQPLLAST